jgi:predicted transcriptional regulator
MSRKVISTGICIPESVQVAFRGTRIAPFRRMSVGRICVRLVQVAESGESAREAARRMAAEDVGTLVILDAEKRPVGIVTDRDIMVHCVAEARVAADVKLSAIMSAPVVTVPEGTPIEDALGWMARDGVRRLVVVDDHERLVGILSLDDVLELLAEETATIGRLLSGARA